MLIKARDAAYIGLGIAVPYSTARTALKKGIKSAKLDHKRRWVCVQLDSGKQMSRVVSLFHSFLFCIPFHALPRNLKHTEYLHVFVKTL